MRATLPRQCLLTPNQLSRALGVSRHVAVRLCRDGHVKAKELPGIGVRVRLEDALEYVRRASANCDPLERLAAKYGLPSSWWPSVAILSRSPVDYGRLESPIHLHHVTTPFSAGVTLPRGMDVVVLDGHFASEFRDAMESVRAMARRPLVGIVVSEDGTGMSAELRPDLTWQHPEDWSRVMRDVLERVRGGG